MEQYQLGPNGGLLYCLEYLENNIDWLLNKLASQPDAYVIFDFPGQVCSYSSLLALNVTIVQVELFTHQTVVKSILNALTKQDARLTAVHLVDSHHCRFIHTPIHSRFYLTN